MKSWNLVFSLLALSLLLAFNLYASFEEDSGNIVERMKEDLNLTTQQVKAVEAIVDESRDQKDLIKQNMHNVGDSDSIKRQIEDINSERNEKLSHILNPDQMEEWNELQEDIHQEKQLKRENIKQNHSEVLQSGSRTGSGVY